MPAIPQSPYTGRENPILNTTYDLVHTVDRGTGIETKSHSYIEMSPYFQLADDLLGGTRKMRAAGTRWLPQFPGETDSEYQWRLRNAVLRNILGKAADSIVGHMFRNPLDKSDLKLDKQIIENFDLRGTSVDQYAANVARKMLTHGLAHTFTDFPRVEGETSLDDERRRNIRPYAIAVHPSDLWFSISKVVNGADRVVEARWAVRNVRFKGLEDQKFTEIRRIRIIGESEGSSGFDRKTGSEIPREQIDDLIDDGIPGLTSPDEKYAPGTIVWEVWRGEENTPQGFSLAETGVLKGLSEIPLRTAYAEYQGFMVSMPVLDSVAHKNREHWQASSDHNSIIQMSRFPMFYATGVSKEEIDDLKVLGPHVKLSSTNESARFGYAETSGSAVEQSFKDLDRIVAEADQESNEALFRPGSNTATGRVIDLMERLSPAQRVAKETERHINEVMKDFSERYGKRDFGMVKVDLDFGFGENEQVIIDALQKARAAGDIPRPYYLKRLQELGVISDDVNPDQLAADADNEQAERGLNSNLGGEDNSDEPEDEGDDLANDESAKDEDQGDANPKNKGDNDADDEEQGR